LSDKANNVEKCQVDPDTKKLVCGTDVKFKTINLKPE